MKTSKTDTGQEQIVHDFLSVGFLYWLCALTASSFLFLATGWQVIIITAGLLAFLLASTYLFKRIGNSFSYRTLLFLKWKTIDPSRLRFYEFFPSIRGGPQSLRIEFSDGKTIRLAFWSDRSRRFAAAFIAECCPAAHMGKSPDLAKKYNRSLKRSLLWVAAGVLIIYLFQRALYQ